MIQEDFNFFKKNRDKIIKGHVGEFVVIKDGKVQNYFKSENDAMTDMKNKGFKLGTYIIQKCISAEEGRVVYYTRRVAF